ncbi:protein S-acyltransferase 10-like [Magnolia sinica]|uniref:protein S-acyltransferase 10-like n=1 Tax=Magnolia sinica TaxID=86752 RepID=UPI00265A7302|nr:protein S-acyltransferase 10-like [Magnolia sinica]
MGFCLSVREAWERAIDRCFQHFPCLSDPGRRSSLGLKVALVVLHLIFVGVLFLFDTGLVEKTRKQPWYTALYLVLFIATLFQYFFTSASSPGYVLDAMSAFNETHAIFSKTSSTSKQSASSKDGSLLPLTGGHQPGENTPGMTSASWTKLLMGMYPPGSSSRNWTCTYCHVLQPPRSKHCHDCDKCVLQFDHHCVWLGTCIGQRNHCRFWWYIFEETILCTWTCILYITFLKGNTTWEWWKDAVMIMFLVILFISLIFLLLLLLFHSYLVLTNQTTYELARRRRISYLRGIPGRVYPFSKGICRNIYNFCCAHSSIYAIEPLPAAEELQARARPYTCMDILTCRCC